MERVARSRMMAPHAAISKRNTMAVQVHANTLVQLPTQDAIDTSWHMMMKI